MRANQRIAARNGCGIAGILPLTLQTMVRDPGNAPKCLKIRGFRPIRGTGQSVPRVTPPVLGVPPSGGLFAAGCDTVFRSTLTTAGAQESRPIPAGTRGPLILFGTHGKLDEVPPT
jgi:hypothetical protein